LEAYLAKHPLLAPEPLAPTVPEPSNPLVDPTLLIHDAQVKRYLTWLDKQDKVTWSVRSVPVPRNTSIKVLDLSTRVHNALMLNGVTTIGQLVQTSSKQILGIRNFGDKSLTEIKKKLEAYLGEHPLLPPEPTLPVEPQPPVPLVDPLLLERAAQVPLGDISVERLALPVHWRNQLRRLGIESVGALTQQTTDVFGQDPLVANQLERYLTWLVEQDEAVWADEVAGRGISPLHRLALAETTLEDLTERWLSPLKPKERHVIRWRYGLNGERLTLEEAGKRLDVTRERVRQLQKRALSVLDRPRSHAVIRSLMELLVYLLKQAGGLMNEEQIEAALQQELIVGDVKPVCVAHLMFALNGGVKWLRGTKAWGLKSVPLDELMGVQTRLVQMLEKERTPLSVDEVVARFKATRFYRNRREKLEDDFIFACLRIHPDVVIGEDGQCGFERWERHRLDEMILALREIGESAPYTVIAEKANALLEPEMQTSAHNIHAHMQRLPAIFVRVGHGIYGLAEWGLHDDGSLANAAYRILREAARPLHIDVLTDEVLKTWRANPGSVCAAVENDARFSRIGSCVYYLREQISGEETTQSQADFGDLFGAQLERWQKDWDRRQGNVELDTQAEVDTIRRIGLDFFND
jgi:RNA polymerase sigma factor (sigma-70 family)